MFRTLIVSPVNLSFSHIKTSLPTGLTPCVRAPGMSVKPNRQCYSTQQYHNRIQTKPRGYYGDVSRQLVRAKTMMLQHNQIVTKYPTQHNRINSVLSRCEVLKTPSAHKRMSTLISLESKDTVKTDMGLRQFLGRVYLRSGLGIAGTVGLAAALAPFAFTGAFPYLMCGGLVLAMGSCLGIIYIKPEIKTITVGNQEVVYAKDKLSRELCFVGLVGGMAMGLAPMMYIITEISPMIVPISLMLTSSIFGGCWWYSKRCSDLQMMKWRAPLLIGLGTLVGGGLLSLGSMLIFGPNMFSTMWQTLDIYGGIALFTGMTIYDMHAAVKMYQEKNPDHIGCSTNLYLDFLNIFIRVMEAMSKATKK